MSPAPRRLPYLLLSAAFLLYAAAFIGRTSFVIDGERYFSLFDDAMISMRYARNLAAGHGLVWDPGGPRVEGITNPLWTGWMALLHLVPLPGRHTSLLVQASAALLLLANLWAVRALALRVSGGSEAAALGAGVLTAFYLPLNNWALQGMEVAALAPMLTAAVLLALRSHDEPRLRLPLYLLLGLATWVRIDMAVPFAVIAAFLVATDGRSRGRHAALALGALVLFLGAQTAARLAYYGDALPNTYYLKMTGYPALLRITRGIEVLLVAAWNANPLLVLLPVGLLLFRRDRGVLLPWTVVAGQLAYSAYVGGDAWEWWGGANRFVAVAAPLFMVLLAVSLRAVAEQVTERLGGGRRAAWPLLLLIAAGSLNALKGPRSLLEWSLARRPMHVEDNRTHAELGLRLRSATAAEARILVRALGVVSYFADRTMIDPLGKVDPRIARGPSVGPPAGITRFVGFHPGHVKWDFAWSAGALRPDLVVWAGDPPVDLQPLLLGWRPHSWRGYSVWVRPGSPRVCDMAAALAGRSVPEPSCGTGEAPG